MRAESGYNGHMSFNWILFVDFGMIGLALLISTFIRSKVRFFQKYLIPNALTAGLLLLPLYNFVMPLLDLGTRNLEELAYHLLSIAFIAMTLRPAKPAGEKGDGRVFAMGIGILSQYALQAFAGLMITFLLISTFMPDLYHSFGFLLPLGFALGPGQALSIGEGWRGAGIVGAGSVGLTFAAIGFLLACFGGVYLINYGIRHKWISRAESRVLETERVRTGVYPADRQPVGGKMVTESEAIDSLSFTAAIVFVVYFLTFLVLTGIQFALSFIGPLGLELATNLWGLSFIFAALMAILVKHIVRALHLEHLTDVQMLNRINGFSVDVLVTASLGAISLLVVLEYIVPIAILASVGGLITITLIPWVCSRIFKPDDHRFLRMLMIYGASTGTLTTGLALLRVLDPDFETPVASDYAYASGLVFALVIPLVLSINLPVLAYSSGEIRWFWLAVLVVSAYLLFTAVSYMFLARERSFRKRFRVWLHSNVDA